MTPLACPKYRSSRPQPPGEIAVTVKCVIGVEVVRPKKSSVAPLPSDIADPSSVAPLKASSRAPLGIEPLKTLCTPTAVIPPMLKVASKTLSEPTTVLFNQPVGGDTGPEKLE